MTDLAWTGLWLVVLLAAVGGAVGLRGLGVPATYVRDLLHVGGGIWVAGWAAWTGALAPLAITVGATVVVAMVPLAAGRVAAAARLAASVTGDDERWAGLTGYAVAVTGLTALAMAGHRFAAGCGLLALALGDGLGGVVGRRFGHLRYRVPWAKAKTVEGSVTVALAAALGVGLAGRLFDHPVAVWLALAVGAVAAVTEAAAPRTTDNLLVPAAAWATAELLT